MKTESDIKDDVYGHIAGTDLAAAVTGRVLKHPRQPGSEREDIVISVLGRVPMTQIQAVVVNVNIYIPEKLQDGQYAADEPRERSLLRLAYESLRIGGIGKDYRFTLESQEIFEVRDTQYHERCVNNKLNYKHYNED